jgi:hypothetical protein
MAKDNQVRPLAECAGGTHILAFAQGEELRAHKSRRSGPAYEANHHDDINDIGAEKGNGREDQKEGREAKDGVNDAREESVEQAEVEPRDKTPINATQPRR